MQENRIVEEFLKLTAFDSQSFCESEIAGYLKGNVEGDAILFSAHMDTVSPGNRKKAIVHPDGTITSAFYSS